MDGGDVFNADDQDGDLDPNDLWLMRAAGGEEEADDGVVAAAATPHDDDQFSFEDSERFEEDSLCSWLSDTESLNQNWRGWNTARSSAHVDSDEIAFGESGGSHRYTGGISGSGCQHGHHSAASSLSSIVCAGSPASASSAPGTIKNNKTAPAVALRNLAELAAQKAARYYSFDSLEASYHAISAERRRTALRNGNASSGADDSSLVLDSAFTNHAAIPDKFFLSIVRWCFPESEEDIRLYSCLANGNADEFGRGEYLYQTDAVRDVFQIGYHLSAVVTGSVSGSLSGGVISVATPSGAATIPSSRQSKTAYNVSIRVDRCRIVSCSCSCAYKASWCQHVVSVCLHRINRSQDVEYRVTIWDSINELSNEKLKKLAQFLINDLPRQYLPLAQGLIDQLRNPQSEINAAVGAPDPTDGGHEDIAIWCLDQKTLHENIRRILVKFCIPSPTVHCDVQYLSSNQPPAASELQSLLRPHRSKDPEGLWNLLSIVREMFKRRDENATSLLHIITEECLACSQVLLWWYQTALSQSGQWSLCSPSGNKSSSLMSSQNAPQFSCASLCDEIVQLWRLAALNPRLSALERDQLASFLQTYHRTAVERIWKIICTTNPDVAPPPHLNSSLIPSIVDRRGERLRAESARFTVDLFPGFLHALKACYVEWNGVVDDYAERGYRQTFNPNKFLSVAFCSSSRSSHASSSHHCSPNIPILRRHSRVLGNAGLMDVPGTSVSLYRSSLCQPGSSFYSVHQQTFSRSTKRRKKSTRVNRRRGHQLEFHDERSLARAARAAVSAARELILGEEGEEESAESGQESEEGHLGARAEGGQAIGEEGADDGSVASSSRHHKLPSGDVDEVFAHAHVQQTNWDIKFAKCEALMSHGYSRQACDLAVELAEEVIEKPPDLLHHTLAPEFKSHTESPSAASKINSGSSKPRRRVASQSGSAAMASAAELDSRFIESSQLAANTYMRTIFLVQTLMKEPKTHRLAFSLALFALELPRGPAATRFLEVKLYYLETELVSLLRRLEIGAAELRIVRDCARKFVESAATNVNRLCVLPISLAHYILDALSYSQNISAAQSRRSASGIATRSSAQRLPSDEELAVKVALEALGMKLMASEADYPMLCESTRRQRGELALTMLLRYKDCTEKLALVLDNLLDPTMHRMYKDHQSNAAYYLEQDSVYSKLMNGQRPQYPIQGLCTSWARDDCPSPSGEYAIRRRGLGETTENSLVPQNCEDSRTDNSISATSDDGVVDHFSESCYPPVPPEFADDSSSLASTSRRRSSDEGNESASEESSSGISQGPNTEVAHIHQESLPASASTSKSPSPAHHIVTYSCHGEAATETSQGFCNIRGSDTSSSYFRHGRRKPIPSSPNQASEAQAHYMMELAKRLLIEAGGSQSTVMFNASQNIGAQNSAPHSGPHRQLHICSFLIGLYALGLNNLVSTSWQTRTYSTNVSWIHGQAIEIGCAAIKIVERVWEAHLTPTEVAALADKASQSRDPGMVEAAANLALSVLPKAYALTAAESQKALHQCKEQSSEMLERACKAVEQAAEKDGVYPEVLFKVARHWYDLFCETDGAAQQQNLQSTAQVATVGIHSAVQQFNPASALVSSQTDSVHPPIHQGFCAATANPALLPMQMPFPQMQQPGAVYGTQTAYYHVPPHHVHQANLAHRPAILVPSVPASQAQLMMQYAPRGPVSNSGLPMTVSAHGGLPPQPSTGVLPSVAAAAAASSRALHTSHSAPNLSPMQAAAQLSRRAGVQPTLPPSTQPLAQYVPVGTMPGSAVRNITDHVVQAQMTVNGPMHHHYPVQSTSLAHYPQIGPPAGHLVQSALQIGALHHCTPPPNSVVSCFHHQAPLSGVLSSAGGMVGGDPRMVKLVHAHRVGMKAMETMGNRNLDDNRSYAKFSQNPAYADDVRWLFSIAVKLGGVFTQSFCEVAARSIASPFVLYSLAVESVKVFHWQMPPVNYHSQALLHPIVRSQIAGGSSAAKHNHVPQVRSVLMQSGFPAATAELMQHCVEMFYVAASSKLSHPRFVPSDTEEVVQLVKTAREAFYFIPGPGKLMFDDFMRHVRKQKACKKDVAQRINACIQQPS